MTKQDELIAYIFEGRSHLLSDKLMQWMAASMQFTGFVDTYRDKIRKKVRITRDPESVLDLCGELEVAYCLLNDRRFSLIYEPYASTKKRSPDYGAAYRVNLVFNIEVARYRSEETQEDGNDPTRREDRIQRILLDKLGQMMPGVPNLLVIQTSEKLARSFVLDIFMKKIKTRAERKHPAFFAASHYTSPADFYKEFLHLSAILLWATSRQVWVNKQAQPGIPEKVLRLIASPCK